jgi:hypothetical protein
MERNTSITTSIEKMSAPRGGFLVVLSDVKYEDERDYFEWLTTEHAQERLAIPGFLGVRIFRRQLPGAYRYFIWYRLENSDIVDSPAYLERLNHPTPWSRRIMPRLENFGRGGGVVAASEGNSAGEVILVAELKDASGAENVLAWLVKSEPEVAAAGLFVTDEQKSGIRTSERGLRRSDNGFSGLLIIESSDIHALESVRMRLAPVGSQLSGSLINGFYRQVFSLERS